MAKVDFAEYFQIMLGSFAALTHNILPLILPVLISLLFFVGLLIILSIEAVLTILILAGGFTLAPQLFTTPLAITLYIIFGIIDLALVILIQAYTSGMFYGVYKEITDKQTASTHHLFTYGKTYFTKIFEIILMRLALFLAPLLIITIIALLAALITPTLAIIIVAILALPLLCYYILLAFAFLFIAPIIVYEKGTSITLVKHSFTLLKTKLGDVLLAWSILFLTGLVFGIAMMIILLPLNILAQILPLITIFSFTLRWLIQLILGFAMGIYAFKAYKRIR